MSRGTDEIYLSKRDYLHAPLNSWALTEFPLSRLFHFGAEFQKFNSQAIPINILSLS